MDLHESNQSLALFGHFHPALSGAQLCPPQRVRCVSYIFCGYVHPPIRKLAGNVPEMTGNRSLVRVSQRGWPSSEGRAPTGGKMCIVHLLRVRASGHPGNDYVGAGSKIEELYVFGPRFSQNSIETLGKHFYRM